GVRWLIVPRKGRNNKLFFALPTNIRRGGGVQELPAKEGRAEADGQDGQQGEGQEQAGAGPRPQQRFASTSPGGLRPRGRFGAAALRRLAVAVQVDHVRRIIVALHPASLARRGRPAPRAGRSPAREGRLRM